MGFADHYLGKNKALRPLIKAAPAQSTGFIVVIPAYREPGLCDTLQSLWDCTRPERTVEIIVVINAGIHESLEIIAEQLNLQKALTEWINRHTDPAFRFHIISCLDMPQKYAGVGFARKTGMDEALMRFVQTGNSKGYILSLDADSTCDSNYFTAIEKSVSEKKNVNGFNIYFEHPVSGKDFSGDIYRGITDYELHLRYNNLFLRYIGFPHAFHTVGSCFGVRADVYAQQGGMNKRKAGEDFYFLHKIIPLGDFIEITSTRVIPSPRVSERVPFGTGVIMARYCKEPEFVLKTYAPDSYLDLKDFIGLTPKFYRSDEHKTNALIKSLPLSLQHYLSTIHITEAINEINTNCRSEINFVNRFFRWFDALAVVKYLNYARRSWHEDWPVNKAAEVLLRLLGIEPVTDSGQTSELLNILRKTETGR